MVGQVGVDGLHAQKLVELVLNNVLEAARDRLLFLVGNLVLEVGRKDKCATSNLARVRNETFRGITDYCFNYSYLRELVFHLKYLQNTDFCYGIYS